MGLRSYLLNERKRAARRGWPIMGYVGPNGGGKSLMAVWDSLPSLEEGRPVLSTVRLLDYRNPRDCDGCDEPGHIRPVYGPYPMGDDGLPTGEDRPLIGYETHKAAHPLWIRFSEWDQLLEAKDLDVIMDEVTGVASSRESHSMPSPVANKLVQMRRDDVIIRWTAPAWARSDKIIRECSQAVTFCEGSFSVVHGEGNKAWRQRRLTKAKTYDAKLFEDFTQGKRESLVPEQSDLHWGPWSLARLAYDTYDAVSSIGTVTDTGRCYRCGGRREIPRCKCGPGSHTGEGAGVGGKPEGRPEPVPVPVRLTPALLSGGAPIPT